MKIMFINNKNKGFDDLSPENELELFQKTSAWFTGYREQKKCLEVYYTASGSVISIWEVSPEESVAIGFEYPMRKYTTAEAYPLFDLDVVMSGIAKLKK